MAALTRLTAVPVAAWLTASAWDLGIVPGNGDTATLPATTTTTTTAAAQIGDAATYVATALDVAGTLVLQAKLSARGGVLVRGTGEVRWDGAAADLDLDRGTHGTAPTVRYQTGAKFRAVNTSRTARARFGRPTGQHLTGPGLVPDSGQQVSDIDLRGMLLQNLGGATRDEPAIMGNYGWFGGNTGQTTHLEYVEFDNCGMLYRNTQGGGSASANKGVRMLNCTERNSRAADDLLTIELSAGQAHTEDGHADLIDCRLMRGASLALTQRATFRRTVFEIGTDGGTSKGFLPHGSGAALQDSTMAAFESVVYLLRNNAAPGGTDIQIPQGGTRQGLILLKKGAGNVGLTAPAAATRDTYMDDYFVQNFTGAGDPSWDWFAVLLGSTGNGAGTKRVFMRRGIVAPDGVNPAFQSSCNGGMLNNQYALDMHYEHCTVASNFAQSPETNVKLGEALSVNIGVVLQRYRNNFTYDPNPATNLGAAGGQALHIVQLANTAGLAANQALINTDPAEFGGNAGWGLLRGTSGYGYHTTDGTTMKASGVLAGPTAHPTTDIEADPQFLDPLRSWAKYYALKKGTTGSATGDLDACIAEVRKKNDASGFDPEFEIALIDAWTRQGWQPRNEVLRTAGLGGVTPGAVAMAPAPTISGVAVTPTAPSVVVGQTVDFTVTITGTNQPGTTITPIWQGASRGTVVLVSGAGTLEQVWRLTTTSVGTGTLRFTATDDPDLADDFAEATITVAPVPAISGVTADPASASRLVGVTVDVTVQITGAGAFGKTITPVWVGTPRGTAVLQSGGGTATQVWRVTPTSAGTGTLRFVASDDPDPTDDFAEFTLVVTAAPTRQLVSLQLSQTSLTGVADGSAVTITISGMMSDGVAATAEELAGVTLTSSDPAVAEVLP